MKIAMFISIIVEKSFQSAFNYDPNTQKYVDGFMHNNVWKLTMEN